MQLNSRLFEYTRALTMAEPAPEQLMTDWQRLYNITNAAWSRNCHETCDYGNGYDQQCLRACDEWLHRFSMRVANNCAHVLMKPGGEKRVQFASDKDGSGFLDLANNTDKKEWNKRYLECIRVFRHPKPE